MNKVMYLKEQKGNVAVLEYDMQAKTKYKAYINSFKINSKIVNMKFEDESVIVFLSNRNVIVLDSVKLLRRHELKQLKKAIQNEIFSRISKRIKSKTKLTLEKIQNINVSKETIISVSLATSILMTLGISKSKRKFPSFRDSNDISNPPSFIEIITSEPEDSESIDIIKNTIEDLGNKLNIPNYDDLSESLLDDEPENSELTSEEEIETSDIEEDDKILIEQTETNEISSVEYIDEEEPSEEETFDTEKVETPGIVSAASEINNVINNNVSTNSDEIVRRYANMYFIDYEDAIEYINEDIDMINEQNTYELGVIRCLKDRHWADSSIDKTPIVSEKTLEEKIKFIMEIANIYGVYDEDTLATIYGVIFAETGGTSYAFIYLNNCGGVMEGNSLARCKTFEIGAERFVRTFLNVKRIVQTNGQAYGIYYNPNLTLEQNMVGLYNGASPDIQSNWVRTVAEYKQKAINSGILDDYTKSATISR